MILSENELLQSSHLTVVSVALVFSKYAPSYERLGFFLDLGSVKGCVLSPSKKCRKVALQSWARPEKGPANCQEFAISLGTRERFSHQCSPEIGGTTLIAVPEVCGNGGVAKRP